jgi:hypothetical protein
MAGKVLIIDDILIPDRLAYNIANQYISWENDRQVKVGEWEEIQRYIFATDTTKTSNAKLPWSNKTTIPKLCQIRDNLFANYMATLFPKRNHTEWEADSQDDNDRIKKEAIQSYMFWAMDRDEFYSEARKIVADYIDYGNCFATVDWSDRSNSSDPLKQKKGYVGPIIRRISPLDIVFNPSAPNFASAPKIVRSLVSLGEVKGLLEQSSSTDEDRLAAEELYTYLKDIRGKVGTSPAKGKTWTVKDAIYNVAGFDSFNAYLCSNTVEVLTFYGDIYDEERDEFLRDVVIKVVDRHKVIYNKPNDSVFGTAPIYHTGWRIRPDNLWAMGPLDNLVGMQYRLDHLENLKADATDMAAFPVFKIKGHVEEFEWAPLERIYVGDDSDVSLLTPPVQTLQINSELANIERLMEEMAGSPREAMGFRTPGEKTAYEVKSMENGASRIFQSKVTQLEMSMFEYLCNAMLELARRMITKTTIRAFDPEFNTNIFSEITAEDISGNGRIKPVAARNFAQKSELVQNLSNFFASSIGSDQDVKRHFSSIRLAQMIEQILDLENYHLVLENVRLSEQADAQRLMNSQQEQVAMDTMTPSGMLPGDFDPTMMTPQQ